MPHVTYIDEPTETLHFFCPGCSSPHAINYGSGQWSWNGDRESPTFSPSVLSNAGQRNPEMPLCHSYVRDGQIEFLTDSTHSLSGQTVPLPPW